MLEILIITFLLVKLTNNQGIVDELWVRDTAFFGICPIHKCNYFDTKFKQDYASSVDNSHCSKQSSSKIVNNDSTNAEIVYERSSDVVVDNIVMNASNKVQSVNIIPSVVVDDNIVMNKAVNNKPSINTTTSNTRKRTASMGPTISNSRIRIDNDGYKYPSKPNTVPIRSTNVVNNNIVLENKFANLAQLPEEREFTTHLIKSNPEWLKTIITIKQFMRN
ncbi:hypothetical protein AVEN_75963-1 [Araneus ventricosus]|uniref:BESS domain-containing protein n=1 Tax=Araneus ventricosus TaxID=182803 RepID=A0A4Y2RT43_ARAVE|nr:hypothetical protein AVEN_75963-1 [Araneus ventricosus]